MCDETCEKGKTHQRECSILASHPDVDINKPDQYRCITPLRLLLARIHYPERFKLTETLMDHNADRQKYGNVWQSQRTFVNDYLKKCRHGMLSDFTDDDFDRVAGLLWTNSFSCKDSEGMAIFPVFSIVSHSCTPNANPVRLQSQNLALVAKSDIAKGEEITISYISILQVKPICHD